MLFNLVRVLLLCSPVLEFLLYLSLGRRRYCKAMLRRRITTRLTGHTSPVVEAIRHHSWGGTRTNGTFEVITEGRNKRPEPGVQEWTWEQDGDLNNAFRFARELDEGLYTKNMLIDRRLHGIPFKIDDAFALDACMQHHRCAVRPVNVERFLLPFWLVDTSCSGAFRGDVYQRDPMSIAKPHFCWVQTPLYEFVYPFLDHNYFNQVSASYQVSNSVVETTLRGNHIPSMLIERFELLEELETMSSPPISIPFEMSTETAIGIASKANNREVVESVARKELKKYHGNYLKATIHFDTLLAEATKIRPVYLPMYRLMVCTSSNSKPVPTYICGATGKVTGPVVHIEKKVRVYTGLGTAATTAGICSIALSPEVSSILALAAALGVQFAMSWWRFADAARAVALEMAEVQARGHMNAETDSLGWKWTPAEEEKAQYHYREEIRAKARRRMAFEERVREETARDEAMRNGRAYKEERKERRRSAKIRTVDPDPLSYYKMLELTGKEGTCTVKEIGRAFRIQAAKHHPDLCPEDKKESAHQTMQRLLEAYNVLRDTKLRADYDSGRLTAAT